MLFHTAGEADLPAVVYHLADRAHNSCCTADAALCKIRQLRQSLTGRSSTFMPRYILCNVLRWERRVTEGRMLFGLGNDKSSFFVDEDKVGAAGLLYIGAGCGTQGTCFHRSRSACAVTIGMQAHRIVQTSLDMSGSMRCCTVKITDTDGNADLRRP